MVNVLKYVAIPSIAILVSLLSSDVGKMLGKHFTPQASRAAYTIEYVDKSLNTLTGRTVVHKHIQAQRSDGSSVRVNLDDMDKPVARAITIVPDRKSVVVSEPIQSVSTTYLSLDQLADLLVTNGDPTCKTHPDFVQPLLYRVVESGMFAGQPVMKGLIELKSGTIERWEAPACGCEPLFEKRVTTKPDGTILRTSEMIATSVTVAEPDASLFEVPTSYTEKAPSVLTRETAKALGKEYPATTLMRHELVTDQKYYDSRRFKPK